MITFLYDTVLFCLLLLAAPKALFQKKYRSSWRARLGFAVPSISKKRKVLWAHAVSVGEVKALSHLIPKLLEHFPGYVVVMSTTTQTGLDQARRLFPALSASFLIPFDFSFLMKRVMRKIHPNLLLLSESDFWYHALKYAKAQGAKVILVNGKISARSFARFRQVPFFTKRLFSLFDHLCIQNEEYRNRFSLLNIPSEKLSVTGNLKLESISSVMTAQEKGLLLTHLALTPFQPVIVIGSTHDPEEEMLLSELFVLFETHPTLKILLVPRHPERFSAVSSLLNKRGWPHSRFSQENPCSHRLILIDQMGILNACYEIATLAIVAGSYTEKVGGHNVLEPVLKGVPVFFGPHMHTQTELKELVLSYSAGKQVPMQKLLSEVIDFLDSPKKHTTLIEATWQLQALSQKAVDRTVLQVLEHTL
ncbi:MAG: putative transferase [Chlamydiota bacterium]|jgi:3-deoxy-D-manno-octulosonic-acid transferase